MPQEGGRIRRALRLDGTVRSVNVWTIRPLIPRPVVLDSKGDQNGLEVEGVR